MGEYPGYPSEFIRKKYLVFVECLISNRVHAVKNKRIIKYHIITDITLTS